MKTWDKNEGRGREDRVDKAETAEDTAGRATREDRGNGNVKAPVPLPLVGALAISACTLDSETTRKDDDDRLATHEEKRPRRKYIQANEGNRASLHAHGYRPDIRHSQARRTMIVCDEYA